MQNSNVTWASRNDILCVFEYLKRFIRKFYNYKFHTEAIHHDRKASDIDVDDVHKLRQTCRSGSGGNEVYVPKLWRNPDQTLRKMQEIRSAL